MVAPKAGPGISQFDGGRGQGIVKVYTAEQIRRIQQTLAEHALEQPEELREQWLTDMMKMLGVWTKPTGRECYRLVHSGVPK
jgi:hypothetical protein